MTERTEVIKKRTTTVSNGFFSQTNFFVRRNSSVDRVRRASDPKKRKYIFPVIKYSWVNGKKKRGNINIITYSAVDFSVVKSDVSCFIKIQIKLITAL